MASHSATVLRIAACSDDLPGRILETGMDWTPRPVGEGSRRSLGALLRDLEANGPSRFALANGCSIDRISVVRYVNDL